MERWKDVLGYESFYSISTYGRLKSLPGTGSNRKSKEFIRKPYINSDGYYQIILGWKIKEKCVKIHRLVAEAFLPKISGKNYVNHKDGNKLNNNVDNLEWVTIQENLVHKYKMSKRKVLKISECKLYDTIKEASEMCGVTYSIFYNHIHGVRYSECCNDYKFVFIQ